MRKIYLVVSFCILSLASFGQVTALDPLVEGGFESATNTLSANGWTEVQGAVARIWRSGTAAGAAAGSKSAYIGTTSAFGSNSASGGVHHFYRDITIPGGATNVLLNFALRYTPIDNTYDYFYVFTTSTSNTPVAGTVPGAGYTQRFVNTATAYTSFTNMATINLTALAGTTFRLVFSFRNDGAAPQAAAAVDKVSVTYTAPSPCSGTPAPGNTVAASTSVCSGSSASLSLQNSTPGSGVSYQWKSAPDVSGSPGTYTKLV
jgi:hypothetical protein